MNLVIKSIVLYPNSIYVRICNYYLLCLIKKLQNTIRIGPRYENLKQGYSPSDLSSSAYLSSFSFPYFSCLLP